MGVSLDYMLDLEPESSWLFVTPTENARTSLLYVQEVGEFFTHEKYYTKREGLPSFLLKYTITGEGVLKYGNEEYLIRPGEIFWIDTRNKQFYYTSQDTKEWRMLWVHFYGANSESYYKHFLELNGNKNNVTVTSINGVERAIRALIALYSNDPGKHPRNSLTTDIIAADYLTGIMTECIKASRLSNASKTSIPEIITLCKSYLASQYMDKITLDDLAKRYAISKFYFEKMFKQHIGVTPNKYLILTRLNQAKTLLRTTDNSISEISDMVGIPNVSHFINLFRKYEETTPAVFRKKWSNME